MTTRTKNIITEIIAVAAVVGFAVFFWMSLQRLEAWADAEIDQVERNYLPVAEDRIAVVASPPDQFAPQHVIDERGVHHWYGDASFYDYTFDPGENYGRVCNRIKEDCYTEDRFVAASRDFPRGSMLVVENLNTSEQVVVLVTDYGPDEELHPERIVDLSSFAFSQIADLSEGIIPVSVYAIP